MIVAIWRDKPLEDPPTSSQELVHSERFRIPVSTGLFAGITLTIYYFAYSFAAQKEQDYDFSNPRKKLFESADERGTATQKRACSKKIEKLLKNGRKMHEEINSDDKRSEDLTASKKLDLKSQSDPVFQAYVLHGEDKEECASWAWVIRGFISRDLFDVEGIWIPSRVWVFQVMQMVVLVLFCIAIRTLINASTQAAAEAKAELPEGLPDWIYGKYSTHSDKLSS